MYEYSGPAVIGFLGSIEDIFAVVDYAFMLVYRHLGLG